MFVDEGSAGGAVNGSNDSSVKSDSRRDPRVPMTGDVTVVFDVDPVVGPGENISAQGVYFTTAAALKVHVRMAGSEHAVPGELVRVESMGNGRVGIAVRFTPQAD